MVSVEILSQYPTLASLPAPRLRAAARASREEVYDAGEPIPMQTDWLYILQEGDVILHVELHSGRHCGGIAMISMDSPGQIFGWRSVVQDERLDVRAVCQGPTRLIAVDLDRLKASETGFLLRKQAVACLYSLLQDTGLCPRNPADRVVLGAEVCNWADEDLTFAKR